MAREGNAEPRRICPVCHVGQIAARRTAHAEWRDGELIVVSSITADICDYCGETAFHDDKLWRLDQLLRYGTDLARIPSRPRGYTIM
jgi:YgiT-type zinc finger domain-containing protein